MNKGLFEASEEGTPQGGPLRTDEWLRRRIRMCIWKAWKKVKTKVANLIRCVSINTKHIFFVTII